MIRSSALLPALLALAVAACAPQQKPAPKPRRAVAVAAAPRADAEPSAYAPYIPWGEHSIATRLEQIGPRARKRWQRWFEKAGVAYPARSVVLVGLKRERQLEVYAGPSRSRLSFVRRVPIWAASGGPGPKLREGDLQVPEGVYEVDHLNPNSAYHVSLRLAYPNAFDEKMAERDGRRRLGGQIMIHGNAKSIGCIAVGDEVAEDLFVLVADAGMGSTQVVLVPRDFRRTKDREPLPGQPAWLPDLYTRLDRELAALPPRESLPVVASRPKTTTVVTKTVTKPSGPPRIYANELDARRRALAAQRRIVVQPRRVVPAGNPPSSPRAAQAPASAAPGER